MEIFNVKTSSQENKRGNAFYGRLGIAATILPYLFVCGVYKGYVWKGLLFYLIYREIDAVYDFGMYLNFFIHGPKQLKRVLSLDSEKSFAQIQAALFVKHAAQLELEKAMGEKPRKNPLETVMIRSFKNQFKDTMMQWKNLFSYAKY